MIRRPAAPRRAEVFVLLQRDVRRAFLFAVLAVHPIFGQAPAEDPSKLTVERLYHPTLRRPVATTSFSSLAWLSDGVLQEMRPDPAKGGVALLRVDPKSFESAPLLDEAAALGALVKAGAPEAAAKAALGGGDLVWNAQRTGFAATVDGDLWFVELASGAGRRLCNGPGAEDEAVFSPDGARVAYLRGNDLYAATTADGVETRLTTDGTATLLNGRLDWVYQEELYGRGNWRGFWWSPDGQKIAYLQLDESKVPAFTVLDHRPLHQAALTANYPKVGDPNPGVRLGVVAAGGGATQWMADPHAGKEILISNVGWTPDNRPLAQWQNRAQTWLDLVVFDAEGKGRTLLRETTKAWVERANMPTWLDDGSFLWESDRSGNRHLYRHAADGSALAAVTSGPWDVTEVHGVDEKRGVVYFSGKERSPLGADVYRVGLDGRELKRLTAREGTYQSVRFSPDFAWFLAIWSDVHTPPQQALYDGEGALARVIDGNPSPAWQAVRKGKVSFQQVPTRDGFAMETMLVLPPDFDAAKKYPVMTFLYGGPNIPFVANRWSRWVPLSHLLAQEGYVVWMCENRSASGKGIGATWPVHKNLGELELRDQLDGLEWLKKNPWVDASRVGIHGWSYGGYMTLYALTRSTAYKIGISGAPVTDWRLYDSIYTERYMGLLDENKDGYAKASVVASAKDLSGRLLLIHGTLDDNVHPQNTLQFLDALHAAGKTCELALLPGSDHSPRAPANTWGYFATMIDFIRRNL